VTRARHEDTNTTGFVRYCVDEAIVSLRRRWRVATLSTLLLAMAVFVLAAYALASQQLAAVAARMNAAAELSVYLDPFAPPGARDGLETLLRREPAVQRADVVDAAQAAERFLRDFPELADVVRGLPDGPFGAVVEVRLSPEATNRDIDALVGRLRQQPGVDDVIYDREVLSRVLATVQVLQRTGGVLTLLLALAATGVVAAVLRLAYYERRDEIDVLALLGAPPRSITGPFVVEGMLQALIGAVVALVSLMILAVSVGQVAARWMAIAEIDTLPRLSLTTSALIVLGAIVVGGLAGWLASREPRERSDDS
jgi:cell division transport system permease protein